jgi:branched-chain amino acid transport system permease protein
MPVSLVQGTPRHRAYVVGAWTLAAAVLVVLPFLKMPLFRGNVGTLNRLSDALAFAVAILGLNLLVGFTGQISIGHSAFMGIGAYTTVITVADHHWSYFGSLAAAVVISFVVGCFIGLPALRIRGLYLVVVTFALAIVFPTVIVKFESVTGGSNGKKAKTKLMPPHWGPFTDGRLGPLRWRYFICLVVAAIMFVIARNLVKSRAGRGIVALRDNPTSATVSGVPVPVYKVLMFGVSAMFGGVAGWMLMVKDPFASELSFTAALSITLIVGLVVGGVATISGAIPGAFVAVFLSYELQQLTDKKSLLGVSFKAISKRPGRGGIVDIAFGILLIVIVFTLPGGVIDGLRRLRSKVVRVVPRPPWLVRRMAALRATGGEQEVPST